MESLKEKLNKKVLLILLIAVVVIAAIISTVFIVRNASAKKAQASSNDKAGYSNTEKPNAKTKTQTSTTTEVVTNKEGETFQVVTDKSGVTQTVPMQNGTTKPTAQAAATKPGTKTTAKQGTTTTTKAGTKATAKPTTTTTTKVTTTKAPTLKPVPPANTDPITTPGFLALNSENAAKIQALKNDTGVLIQAGEDVEVWSGGEANFGETDQTLIAKWVDKIDKEIRSYPVGFLREINPTGILKVKLVENLDGLTGYASSEMPGDFEIGMNASAFDSVTSGRTFNHEVMHLIEKHIMDVAYPNNPLEATWAIAPPTINSDNDDYTIADWENPSQNYFTSQYAKTNPRDDRAETFADYMFRPYQKDYMKNSNYPIPRKMQIIANNIRTYFVTTKNAPLGSLPWEALLYRQYR